MFATHMKKKNWFADTAAYLIFDNTVINKKYGYNIELTRLQYSGNEHKVICVMQSYEVCEIRIVNCIYFNPQNKQLWIIDSSIYDPDTDKKTKIEEC
ncbi:MAG: hypothetical protein O4805_24915 [Trichodesmium sp. St16_bin2-tuft]|jgi:hypothetical protein|nr:hypothetical protein [Trichodesmium sp. MAG_R02]MDE5090190.1 hypothetical protein [Trichodesmium sp. St16_bin2-tuft]MDE5112662.1 hypothetical protein [Trichodesmium sp. St7_bin2_1]